MAKVTVKNKWSLYFLALLMVGLAVLIVVSSYKQDRMIEALQERCSADVTAVVKTVNKEKRTRRVRRNKRTVRQTYYIYTAIMVYEMNGQEYAVNDTWQNTSPNSSRYSVGMKVDIKCDPDEPEVYYIRKSLDGKKFILSFIPAAFFVLVAIAVVAGTRSAAKEKKVTNYGMSYEEWSAMKQREQQTDMESADMEGIETNIGINDSDYLDSLNKTDDYMDSI